MRTRILATIGGGVLGFLLPLAFPVSSAMGLTPAWTEGVCALVGVAFGYIGTFLLDIFQTPAE